MDARMLLTLACLSGFAGAFLAGVSAHRSVRRTFSAALSQSFPTGGSVGLEGLRTAAPVVFSYVLRNGVQEFDAAARWAIARPALGKTFEEAARLARRRGFSATARSVASSSLMVLSVAGCICAAASRSVLTGVVVIPLLAFTASAILAREREREQEALREQVPDALRCMEACLHAGLSLPRAFAEVAAEVPSPAKESFSRVSHDLELGYSMNEALARFRQTSVLPELGFVAMALDIQYACGGSASPILHAAEDSVASSLDLRRSLRVQTAQARLSAQIVSIMPFFLLVVLSLVSPGFFSPFFADAEGASVLALALAMQVGGVALVRKTLSVDL